MNNFIDVDKLNNEADYTISELDMQNANQEMKEDVQDFLKEVSKNQIAPDSVNDTIINDFPKRTGTSLRPPIMAFNDVRIQASQKNLLQLPRS